ncbi:crotonase/enoyl-CoA hydratase family protein [Aliiroseovarius crassostreae]|uniref:crotonase/enoyl-CoA hydratase family protein n=1 Tax=Aliiroseovarius crassostreae TaxID=154981 RepID=UPI003C7EA4AA
MSDKLLFDQAGHVVTLTLNAPDTRNALTDQGMMGAIIDAMERVNGDHSIRCVILTGAGKAFSSGGNLKDMRDRSSIFAGDAMAVRDAYKAGIQKVAKAVWDCEVPMIAAVNGPAYGAGCDLTCMCDIRICSENAVFAENFARVGLIAGDGGAWLLPRQIGLSRAAEMTFTGEPVSAQMALDWGLVSKVTSSEDLMAEAHALAERIAYNPPRQLRLNKRLLREGLNLRLDQLLEIAASYQGACHQTEDHAEAVTALLEKRPAKFTGA